MAKLAILGQTGHSVFVLIVIVISYLQECRLFFQETPKLNIDFVNWPHYTPIENPKCTFAMIYSLYVNVNKNNDSSIPH